MHEEPKVLTLASRHSRWRMKLLPERGACAIALEARPGDGPWRPVAQATSAEQIDADQRLRHANYALLPYSNRIAHGLIGALQPHPPRLPPRLPPNLANQPHPLHGLGWLQAWRVQRQAGRELLLTLRWPGGAAWPWAFEAQQRLRLLGQNRLQLDLRLRNLGRQPMPAGLGWHPYFQFEPDLQLRTRVARMQHLGADALPLAWGAAPQPLAEGRALPISALPALDNAFDGWRGRADLRWSGAAQGLAPMRVKLQARGAIRRHCVIYRPPDQALFCLEPVSHANNALAQRADVARRWGLRMLASEASLVGAMVLSLA